MVARLEKPLAGIASQPMRAARYLRWFLVSILVLFIAIQLVRPARSNPASNPSANLMAHATPAVAKIFSRACRDCHSNETQWPVYSQIAPISWLLAYDVREGRDHFNYSEWTSIDPDDQDKLLGGICSVTRRGRMPMPKYVWMHREAKLSATDIEALCAWSEKMRDTIQ